MKGKGKGYKMFQYITFISQLDTENAKQ